MTSAAGAGGDEACDATGDDVDDDGDVSDVMWVVTDDADDDVDDVNTDVVRDVTISDLLEMAFCIGIAGTCNNDLLAFLQWTSHMDELDIIGWRYRPEDYSPHFNSFRLKT